MTTFGALEMSASQYQQQQLIDSIWHAAFNQIRGGSSEIVLSAHQGRLLGQPGVNAVAQRFSMLIKGRTSVLYDPSIDAIRILPPPRVQVNVTSQQFPVIDRHATTPITSPENELASSETESTASPTTHQVARRATSAIKSKIAKERIAKVPRPPNAFILYRQHHHPIVKQNNPGVHNNQISVLLGLQWKNEDESVRAAFKEKADEVRRKHNEKHPEYQYQPRKPSEKKKRASKAKAAKVAASASPIEVLQPFTNAGSSTSSPDLNTLPTLEPFGAQSSLPSFHFTEDGRHMVHDFSQYDPALFDDMVNNHNAQPNLLPATHQGYISPQALLISPSIASSRQYAADAAQLNYPHLDHQSEILRDRLSAEIDAMNTYTNNESLSTAVDVSAVAHPTNTVNASEDAYNNAWKADAQSEDLRMEHLELEFGSVGVPDFANLFYDGGYAMEPIFGSDGINPDVDFINHDANHGDA